MMTWKAVFLAAVLACTAGGGVDAAEMEKLKVAISFAGLWTSSQPIFCKDRGKFSEAGTRCGSGRDARRIRERAGGYHPRR